MGNATAVWATPAGLYGVFMESAYKPVGQSWGKPVRIGRATLPADTQLAGDMSGNVMVVWSSNPDEIGPTVQAAIRSTDGGWQHPVKIGRGHSPQVAVDAQGDAIAVWVDDVGLAPLVRAVAFTRTGAPAFTG
jgi:hypothetical protein